MDDCPDCAAHRVNPFHGGYRAQCLQCCARLLRSARPLRRAQNAMLAALRCHPDAPPTEDIMAALRENDLELALAQIEPTPLTDGQAAIGPDLFDTPAQLLEPAQLEPA